MRPQLIVIGPLPPPTHGVAVSTSLVLANPLLAKHFSVRHLDTSDRRSRGNIGKWDAANIFIGLRSVVKLAGLLRGEPGVVYLPLSQGVPALLRDSIFVHLAALRGWKVAAHLRGSEFKQLYRRCGRLLRLWIRGTLGKIDSIAVMSASLRSVFDELVPSERIAVIPNGTPEPKLHGIVRDPHTILFLSNLRRRKGVVEALEAALVVLSHDPDARFLFAGEWEGPELERALRMRAAEVGGRINFVGPARGEDKDRLLGSAAVLLFPPRDPEGHPRVVIEALAAGLPVVTTDRGAIAETVGEAGFVLPDPVPADVADRVLVLLRDSDLRDQMSRAARKRYLERFTQEEADRRLAAWLEEIALR